MTRTKGAVCLLNKAAAAREFHRSWDQIDYLIRKFHVPPVPATGSDRRVKYLYRYTDLKRLLPYQDVAHAA